MNNPISRMPNPMAPMGQVPSIPPMGANPNAQNPSAMPLPVVNQPSVDMQMMGTTANQRKKFNDLMESLSAPRQPMTQAFKRGGNVQYLKGGGPTMPSGKYSYSKNLNDKIAKLIGGAITTPEEERFKSPPMMGMAESPAMYMAAPVNPYNKNIGVEQGLPKNDPLLTQGQNVKVGMRSGQNVLPNDPVQDTSFMAGQRGKLDQMRAENRKPTFYDAMRGMYYNQKPPILDVPILPMQSGPDSGPIIPAETTFEDDYVFNSTERFDPDYIKFLKEMSSGIGSFANGGPVQYFANGGSPKPSYGKYSYAKQPKIKKFDTSTNKDTTITDTASKIGNFFSNLFSGGKSTDTGYGDLSDPKSSFPGSDLNYQRSNKVPKINMDILDMPAPMDVTLPPKVISNVSRNTGYGDLTKPGSAFPGSDLNFHDHLSNLAKERSNLEIPTVENIETQNKFPEQNVRLNMPRQNLIPPAVSIPDILYDDRLDFSTASGINDVAPLEYEKAKLMKPFDTYNPYLSTNYMPNQEKYPNLPTGMGPSDFEFDDFDIGIGTPPPKDFVADLAPAPQYLESKISPRRGPFDDDFGRVDRISPDRGPFDNEFGNVNQIMGPEDFVAYPDVFKTSTPPARSDIFKDLESLQKAQAEAAAKDQSGQTNQQGFGLGQFLPLILGMFNPKLGMALGIMQAMSGQGEGEGEGKGFLGGILPNLAKTLGIGDTERTFGDYTFRSLEDPRSGESAGMTPEERRELFLKNQASNERERARRDMQENIDAITKPTVPEPILGEDGSYSCPSPYVYDPNTKMCVMMEAGLGGQGAAANEPKAPIAMQMGGQVSPSLNNAVDNFLQAFA